MSKALKNIASSTVALSLYSAPVFAEVAYFEFTDVNPEQTFVIQLTDSEKIAQARDIINTGQTQNFHVMGYITPHTAPYNSHWQYHLDTDTIHFFEFAIEVCDASIAYVQQHLDEVGGAFLPNNIWCPWSSRLIREIEYPSPNQSFDY
ncbi:calmodulin-binding protein [Hahella ganghwensis]|uniref:BP74-related protein n=1 Tax=Hahella ganghwensis TaxID=286420 RepID=UPI001B7FD40B|nr:calmodulin-binding protein [Hahella ganghwensis]